VEEALGTGSAGDRHFPLTHAVLLLIHPHIIHQHLLWKHGRRIRATRLIATHCQIQQSMKALIKLGRVGTTAGTPL